MLTIALATPDFALNMFNAAVPLIALDFDFREFLKMHL